jgi:hypothetical protein
MILSIILCAVGTISVSLLDTRKDPEPYHTSILSGEGWLLELLTGHPERIWTELGVHAEVFQELISFL